MLYGLARTPSLAFLALTFAAAAYLIISDLPLGFLAPFVVLTLVVLAAMVWDTLRNRPILEEALSQPITIVGLSSERLRDHVQRAIEYREQLREALLTRNPESGDLAAVEDAAVLIERLCRTIDRYEKDRLLALDAERLQRRKVRTAGEEQQFQVLSRLSEQMQGAESEATDLLATLGETYATIRHLEALPETRGKAPEMLSRLRSGSQRLQDTVQALEELYRDSLTPSPKGA